VSPVLAAGLVLAIQAEPTARWSVSCEVLLPTGRDLIEFVGSGPTSRPLPGDSVECVVELVAGGQLGVAMVDAQGNRSQSRVTGAGSTVRLRRG
jgi:hypothetical protein